MTHYDTQEPCGFTSKKKNVQILVTSEFQETFFIKLKVIYK